MEAGGAEGPRTPIEEAYCGAPVMRMHGCLACSVSWFGTDDRCWVCGLAGEGPIAVVPASGTESWSSGRCQPSAEDEETRVLLRRVAAPTEPPVPDPYL